MASFQCNGLTFKYRPTYLPWVFLVWTYKYEHFSFLSCFNSMLVSQSYLDVDTTYFLWSHSRLKSFAYQQKRWREQLLGEIEARLWKQTSILEWCQSPTHNRVHFLFCCVYFIVLLQLTSLQPKRQHLSHLFSVSISPNREPCFVLWTHHLQWGLLTYMNLEKSICPAANFHHWVGSEHKGIREGISNLPGLYLEQEAGRVLHLLGRSLLTVFVPCSPLCFSLISVFLPPPRISPRKPLWPLPTNSPHFPITATAWMPCPYLIPWLF